MTAGMAARDEALARVARNAPSTWAADAKVCVDALARTRHEFTTDDVWSIVGQPPEPRALGPVIRSAARSGVIAQTGRYAQSVRPECHCRPIPVWRAASTTPAMSRATALQLLTALAANRRAKAA